MRDPNPTYGPDTGPTRRELVAGPSDKGERLDRVLARAWPDLSRTRLKGLVLAGAVTIAGETVDDPGRRLVGEEAITIAIPPADPVEPAAQKTPIAIVFEDRDLLVLDKPAGLVVHPAAGHESGTLVNALIAHCGESLSGIGGARRPGIVHRLDKDTSGLLVVAKNDIAHQGLCAQFADHGRTGPLQRAYQAIVWGVPPRRRGVVNAPLERSSRHRDRMSVAAHGKGREAITHYEIDEFLPAGARSPPASLLTCRLETGRTHQIRVHMAHLGHPLLGDPLYGSGFRTKASLLASSAREIAERFARQALHAAVLGFAHPRSGETLVFESPLPEDMRALLHALRQDV